VYDTNDATYSPVLLGQDGDLAFRNTAAAAASLVDWLVSLYGQERVCPFDAPEDVPVSSCDACAADEACVADCDGHYHCQRYWYASPESDCPSGSDPSSCACVGAQICAAGSSWCSGTPTAGLTCVAP
ncbi:MAG: hypothetical protein P8099_20745, partial [Gemmatimonadota bacterium]